jgi:hypothetical protein
LKHFASAKFWARYHELPKDVRDLADKNYRLLKENSQHPSLHFKRVGKLWSVRAGEKYRALAIDVDGGVQWFWIGTHNDYENLVG